MADPRKARFRFWRFFFSLKGRVSRWPFLAFELPTRLAMLVAAEGLKHLQGLDPVTRGLYTAPLGLAGLVLLWPNFALLFKRFHDANLSGLWALAYFAPLAYGMYTSYTTFEAIQVHDMAALKHGPPINHWIWVAFGYGLLFIAGALAGSKAGNRFGPKSGDPPNQVQDVF